MTQYDPNDPARPIVQPAYTETVETVVVRESNTGWWIAGILGGVVLIAVLWILFARPSQPQTDPALLQAQVDAAQAQAQADAATAAAQGQATAAQAGADIARADALRSQAEAQRAEAEARAAEARAATPVVVERPAASTAPSGVTVVTPTAPQN